MTKNAHVVLPWFLKLVGMSCEAFFSCVNLFVRSFSLKEVTIIYRWSYEIEFGIPTRFDCLIQRICFLNLEIGLSHLGNLSTKEYLFLILFWHQLEDLFFVCRKIFNKKTFIFNSLLNLIIWFHFILQDLIL